jgi:hypothetical protein
MDTLFMSTGSPTSLQLVHISPGRLGEDLVAVESLWRVGVMVCRVGRRQRDASNTTPSPAMMTSNAARGLHLQRVGAHARFETLRQTTCICS